MNNTAHTRVSEEVTKKQVMFPVIYASQSFPLPRQPHHSQSKFLSPPVPLTSPCHYIFFEIPLMKNESFSCQHRLEPVACHSFAVVFWSKAPPSGFSRPYFHTTQERMLQSKLVDEVILCGSRKVAGNQNTNWLFPWDIQLRE